MCLGKSAQAPKPSTAGPTGLARNSNPKQKQANEMTSKTKGNILSKRAADVSSVPSVACRNLMPPWSPPDQARNHLSSGNYHSCDISCAKWFLTLAQVSRPIQEFKGDLGEPRVPSSERRGLT